MSRGAPTNTTPVSRATKRLRDSARPPANLRAKKGNNTVGNKIIRGYWDCSSCDTKGIRGDVRNCPGCGKPRGDDVKFYMKDKEYLSDEEASKVSHEADWFCEYCGALNSANDTKCKGCGAEKAASDKDYNDLRAEEQTKAAKKAEKEQAKKLAELQAAGKKRRLILGAALLVIIGLIAAIFMPKTSDATVTQVAWDRSIAIEQYQDVEESDWELPEGANLHEQKREVHHYEQVLDHYQNQTVEKSREVIDHYETVYEYEDLGNGNFEEVSHEEPVYVTEYYTEVEQVPVYRDDPVYQTKYYYDIWKWVEVRSSDSSGTDHNPTWNEPTLASDEREGTRTENYTITVETKKGKASTYTLTLADWNKVDVGQSVEIKQHHDGAAEIKTAGGETINATRVEE